MAADMEIVSVGNELLIGKVINTNAQWLARRATSLGLVVKRITVVRDDVEETAEVIQGTLTRKPKIVLTTGGLGPTFDDKTLESIGYALERKLEVNQEALQMVRQKYKDYSAKKGTQDSAELTKARVKMAIMPQNARPIHNPVGTAPAVEMDLGETVLIALPGVPAEMEAIFEESVVPKLKEVSNGAAFFERGLYVDNMMESVLAPLIDQVMRSNPRVYIKSHPKGAENAPHLEIHFSTTGSDKEEAAEGLSKAASQLSELVVRSGGRVVPNKQAAE